MEVSTDGTDESSWELDPEDESGAVIATVGRQLKMWREAAGLDRAKFGERMGYGANLIYKIERGARIPRPEFLDKADEVLGAGGKIASMKADIERARYPKTVRDWPSWKPRQWKSDRTKTVWCQGCSRPRSTPVLSMR